MNGSGPVRGLTGLRIGRMRLTLPGVVEDLGCFTAPEDCRCDEIGGRVTVTPVVCGSTDPPLTVPRTLYARQYGLYPDYPVTGGGFIGPGRWLWISSDTIPEATTDPNAYFWENDATDCTPQYAEESVRRLYARMSGGVFPLRYHDASGEWFGAHVAYGHELRALGFEDYSDYVPWAPDTTLSGAPHNNPAVVAAVAANHGHLSADDQERMTYSYAMVVYRYKPQECHLLKRTYWHFERIWNNISPVLQLDHIRREDPYFAETDIVSGWTADPYRMLYYGGSTFSKDRAAEPAFGRNNAMYLIDPANPTAIPDPGWLPPGEAEKTFYERQVAWGLLGHPGRITLLSESPGDTFDPPPYPDTQTKCGHPNYPLKLYATVGLYPDGYNDVDPVPEPICVELDRVRFAHDSFPGVVLGGRYLQDHTLGWRGRTVTEEVGGDSTTTKTHHFSLQCAYGGPDAAGWGWNEVLGWDDSTDGMILYEGAGHGRTHSHDTGRDHRMGPSAYATPEYPVRLTYSQADPLVLVFDQLWEVTTGVLKRFRIVVTE